jgi:hypothetical protein
MTAMRTAVESSDGEQCWCCSQSQPREQMVHLGNHPEVALCVRCAHFVHKQAWEIEDGSRAGPLVGARDAFRRVRREVVRRGWQHSSQFGPALRWLGKHLP